jgi:ribonuclease D
MGCCTGDAGNWATAVTRRRGLPVARGDLPAGLFDAFRASPLVAWDIETSGLDWRRARIGTCQLFAESAGAAVVSVAGGAAPSRLAALLEEAGVVKVFHHAPFDLRFMVHEWGVRPASVRCTKVASKLLDPEAPNETHSLQRLVSRYVGVDLDKGPVRTSDWTAPVLSPEQVDYATADVVHLPAVLAALQARIAQAGLTWLYDRCCEFLPARAALEVGEYPDVFAY